MSEAAPALPCGARRPLGRRVFAFLRNVLAVIGALFLVFHLCFELTQVRSPSMEPTLFGGGRGRGYDFVLTEKVSYWFRRPRRFEVVSFRNSDGIDVMKRVAGLPGESIASQDNFIAIDGRAMTRPQGLGFLTYYSFGKFFRGRTTPCGSGYFVLGDDSRDSFDSRYEGPIDRSVIRGRAWMIVWPAARLHFVR